MHSASRVPTLTLVLTALVVAAPLAAAGILPDGVPGTTAAPWGAWRTETLDTRFIISGQTGIDVDSQGRAWLMSTTPDQFTILRQEYGAWSSVYTVSESSDYGELRLDDSDAPHVVHSGDYPGKAYYTTQAPNGSWHTTLLDGRTTDFELHIALDAQDTPHVAYVVDHTVQYQVKTDSGWVREQVTPTGASFGRLDLAVDSQGRAHIVYQTTDTDGEDELGYALRGVDGSWTLEEIPACNTDPTIAVDSNDEPRVACHVPGVGLGYATKDASGAWSTTVIDDGDRVVYERGGFYVGHEPSIAVDAQDRVHISYRYKGNFFYDHPLQKGELHYIAQDGLGGWVKEVVDHDGNQNGRRSAIALDSSGRPHISYVLQHRFNSLPCQDGEDNQVVNPCFILRYATPAQSALTPLGE